MFNSSAAGAPSSSAIGSALSNTQRSQLSESYEHMFSRAVDTGGSSGSFDVEGAGENVDNLLGATLAATEFDHQRSKKAGAPGTSNWLDHPSGNLLDHTSGRSVSMV